MRAGKIVRLLRISQDQSQTDLALELGIARTYLSQVESGKIRPGLGFLTTVSKKFRIPLPLLVLDPNTGDHKIFAELRTILEAILAERIQQANRRESRINS